jgi:hypothetical protein
VDSARCYSNQRKHGTCAADKGSRPLADSGRPVRYLSRPSSADRSSPGHGKAWTWQRVARSANCLNIPINILGVFDKFEPHSFPYSKRNDPHRKILFFFASPRCASL